MKTLFFRILLVVAGCNMQLSAQVYSPIVDSIPMRDGRKLAADIYIPPGCTQCPVILIQTPYNRLFYRWSLPLGVKQNLSTSNYAFVTVDWRGFYGSAGSAYSGSPTRGQDGYDCVQWIAGKNWSNGKVGTWGPSALGGVQYQTARENPPNLVCIVPQVAAPMTQSYKAYYPGGVYRTEYVEQLDALGYGLSTTILANPVRNLLWMYIESLNNYADSIFVPAFMQGGWYDHTINEMLGWFNDIRTQSPVAVRNQHRLLMGPWVHGGNGAAYIGSSAQGQLNYPNAAGWSDSLAMRFLDYHMRNIANGWNTMPYITYYQMGDDMWLNSPSWPPAGLTNYDLYFHSDTTMDLTAPGTSTVSLSYPYNPTNPSPTVGGTTLRADLDQGPYDQSPLVESRGDILRFTTPVLTQDVVMKGSARVHLTVASDRKDTDFSVRLTDVYPDGRSMLLHDGIFRMRFRDGFTAADTAVMIPNTLYEIDIDLPGTCITFKAGHRIRVDVSSSNYPRYNRNANTGNAMYPFGDGDTLINPLTAINKIYVSGTATNSYLRLPLTASPVLGIAEINQGRADVTVFPNPGTGLFYLKSGGVIRPERWEIRNLTGALVLEGSSEIADLRGMPAGIYIVKMFEADRMIATGKLMLY